MSTLLPTLEINPKTPATATVIWLHGLGADGHDFAPIVPELRLPSSMAVRFIFPHAPAIPVTINGGYIMPAWYDIVSMGLERQIDETQILASCAAITALINHEIARGIASNKIILAGFSQGGAVAYQTALAYPQPLAGLLALSTYIATPKSLCFHPANSQLAIQLFHGQYDGVVQEVLGKRAFALLTEKNYAPKYKSYPMEHEVCAEEIADISRWLQERLG